MAVALTGNNSRRGRVLATAGARGRRVAWRIGVLMCLLPALATALEWRIEVTPEGELFPVLELSRAATPERSAYGDGNGLLRVRVSGIDVPQRLQLTVRGEGLRADSVLEVDAAPGEFSLRPHLDWDAAYLRGLSGPRVQALQVSLAGADGVPSIRSIQLRMHPLDEALYYVRDGASGVDLGWIFAAYVDPASRVVDEILAGAFTATPAPARTRAQRIEQARAVWLALEQHGLRYADEDPTISHGPVVYSQRVRLLDTIWRQRIANCIDGSVLIASALERLGMRSFIVLVPGHAFVGWRSGDEGEAAEFLETTLIGRHAPATPETAVQLRRRALANFETARDSGFARYRAAANQLDGRHRPDYAVIDIATARRYGIAPVPMTAANTTASDTVPLAGDE
ncbi:MAG: hypothetical protein ABIY56_05130 [Dokdonella sp.]